LSWGGWGWLLPNPMLAFSITAPHHLSSTVPHNNTPPLPPNTQTVTAPHDSSKQVHSASLSLSQAMWEYCWEARWLIFAASVFFFLSAQASRQVGCWCGSCGGGGWWCLGGGGEFKIAAFRVPRAAVAHTTP